MGKFNRRKGPKNNRNDSNKSSSQGKPEGYKEIAMENAAFEKYYKEQKIVPEEEWDDFMATLRENLPIAFRITGFRGEAKALLEFIQSQYFSDLVNMHVEGEEDKKEAKPFPLPWYPDKLAWQMKISRVAIRKSENLSHLHSFLISETESGNISRQETVSMIPPLLLDIEPHHKVLDMCAAPGSKSAQIIEMLHKEEGKIPEGFLVANDVDNQRCYMLVHQAKRLHSPCILITNHNASNMPNMTITNKDGQKERLKYDRILCDVPCSGDGTIRKNIDVWQKWNIGNGNNLHNLQVLLLQRGLELLAPGGKIVYSTCSLNPVEDEAVISSILQMSKGSVSLVDVSSKLPGLKGSKGLSTWKVMSRNLKMYDSFEQVEGDLATQIRPGMFPPPPEVAASLNLHYCLRILPHQQDTGGFFVALLEKHSMDLPWTKKPSGKVSSSDQLTEKFENENQVSSPPKKRARFRGHREDPFIFITDSDAILPSIKECYQLSPSFPHTQLLIRCSEGKRRNLYFVSQAVKDIIESNSDSVKIVNSGVRVFCRNDAKNAKCDFRLTHEGIPTLLPYYGGKTVELPMEDMEVVLTHEYPTINQFSQSTQQTLATIDSGCVIISHTANKGKGPSEVKLHLCGWKGQNSLRCYVPRQERLHYLRMCGCKINIADFSTKTKGNGSKQASGKVASKSVVEEASDCKREEEEEEEEVDMEAVAITS